VPLEVLTVKLLTGHWTGLPKTKGEHSAKLAKTADLLEDNNIWDESVVSIALTDTAKRTMQNMA